MRVSAETLNLVIKNGHDTVTRPLCLSQCIHIRTVFKIPQFSRYPAQFSRCTVFKIVKIPAETSQIGRWQGLRGLKILGVTGDGGWAYILYFNFVKAQSNPSNPASV